MDELTLEVHGLTRYFGSRLAVDGVSFAARRGDIVGLVGPNGAGKTTVIRMLTTMLAPSAGKFSVAGVPGHRATAVRRQIGVLPDGAGYPGEQSAREYLRFYSRLYGSTAAAAARAADRLLVEVQLDQRAGSPISALSHGMRRRLGIARALVNDPVVLFLDESTLGLDPAGQQQILGILQRIAEQRGATVLLSTHTLTEVESACTQVLILNAGAVVSEGSVAAVIGSTVLRRSARLRVLPSMLRAARAAIAGVEGVTVTGTGTGTGAQADQLTVLVTAPHAGDDRLNAALGAVVRAGIPVVSFEAEGGRLADAFLAVTGTGGGR